MLSKLLQPSARARSGVLYRWCAGAAPRLAAASASRPMSHMLPPTQYDINNVRSKRFQLTHALKEYWELIPMFLSVCASLSILTFAIFWACKNKVDVVFTTHSCDNISRTMNLRRPTVHKMLIINQRYEPWPEMQDSLDKVDVVFSTHSRDNISRTMDLRNPSTHKMYIINQRYEPWPEMQSVLDKMAFAHKRALVRAQTACSLSSSAS